MKKHAFQVQDEKAIEGLLSKAS